MLELFFHCPTSLERNTIQGILLPESKRNTVVSSQGKTVEEVDRYFM